MMYIWILGMVSLIFLWCQIAYYTTMMRKYRTLANMERQRLKNLGYIVPEEPPML